MTRISSLGLLSLIQLLILSAVPSLVTADPIHIPVTRRSRAGPRDVHYYAAAADRLRAKYGFPTSNKTNVSNSRIGSRASSAAISIINQVRLDGEAPDTLE